MGEREQLKDFVNREGSPPRIHPRVPVSWVPPSELLSGNKEMTSGMTRHSMSS